MNYSIAGSLSIVVMSALTGCQQKDDQQAFSNMSQAQNQFFVIVEKPKGNYTVTEQYPTDGETRAILKDADGKERIINEQEMKALAEVEAQKIENGQSNLTNGGGGGLSLGETIMAAAGGALLGNLIGNALSNKLMKNQNFQNRQQAAMKNSNIGRSANSASKSSAKSSSKSGFFGSKGSSRNSRSFFGG